MTISLHYKGYELIPAVWLLTDYNRWASRVNITKNPGKLENTTFESGLHFETKEEASAHAVNFGKDIIDSKIPGLSVMDLH